jgi:hypothetical protein
MATYRVTLEDGRTTDVNSDNPELVKRQANHEETSRVIIAGKRNHPYGPEPALAVSFIKIKD